jgi:DNA-binding transcriptional LysR family regulator
MALLDRVLPPLAAVEASLRDLPEMAPTPTGTLRIAASVDLGSVLLSEAISRFLVRYPDVKVEVQLGAALVDLARGGFDLGLRFAPGALRGTSMLHASSAQSPLVCTPPRRTSAAAARPVRWRTCADTTECCCPEARASCR